MHCGQGSSSASWCPPFGTGSARRGPTSKLGQVRCEFGWSARATFVTEPGPDRPPASRGLVAAVPVPMIVSTRTARCLPTPTGAAFACAAGSGGRPAGPPAGALQTVWGDGGGDPGAVPEPGRQCRGCVDAGLTKVQPARVESGWVQWWAMLGIGPLSAVCCVLPPACYPLHAACYPLHASCYPLHAACYPLHAACFRIR